MVIGHALDAYMTGYQTQRQRAYDRAAHLVCDPNHLDDLEQDLTPTPEGEAPVSSRPDRREPLLMVVAHDPLAEASDYQQGAAILAGPRVGPDTIDLIRCTGRTETMTVWGHHITNLASTSSIRHALRRAVLARDDGCTIDGCNSTYLEVHHIVEQSKGGDHSPDNLTSLCWWHHHVAVHRQGMRIDPQSPPRRRRLLLAPGSCAYQPPPPNPHALAILRILHAHTNRAPS